MTTTPTPTTPRDVFIQRLNDAVREATEHGVGAADIVFCFAFTEGCLVGGLRIAAKGTADEKPLEENLANGRKMGQEQAATLVHSYGSSVTGTSAAVAFAALERAKDSTRK